MSSIHSYKYYMNGRASVKSQVNNMKFWRTVKFRALGRSCGERGFSTPVCYTLLKNPELELLHMLYQTRPTQRSKSTSLRMR
jgi:hypothetical protein